MTFDEWIEMGLTKDVKTFKNESIAASEKFINLLTECKNNYNAITPDEIHTLRDYETETNTNSPPNRISQTHKEPVNTQTTNIPTHNQMNTNPNNICKCEDEMDQTEIQYKSNFARELQLSQPTQYPIEYIQQQTISHLPPPPQQTISHTQYPVINNTPQ